ncbi:MAG TPA: hypothetical protein VF814_05525 [Casimicrobiaceae bacterium]
MAQDSDLLQRPIQRETERPVALEPRRFTISVRVNGDAHRLELDTRITLFVDEFDPHASTIGARGIGELGAVGVGPAIANAVYHATGIRVRELPIRPEMLLR